MGASDSKIVFKKGIFRLSEERHIPADDQYWTFFWSLPESPEDIFSLFTPADLRRARDNAPENLETLILVLCSRLFALRHNPSFPDPEIAPEKDALNCVRVLTRLLPYVYEKEGLEAWEERFFWGKRRRRVRRQGQSVGEVLFDEAQNDNRQQEDTAQAGEGQFEDAPPLAEELLDALVDLLFFTDFTVALQVHNPKTKVPYAIWQSGVGCNQAVATTKEFESNRVEILRLLLAMAGKSMYMTATTLPQHGVRALTYLCSSPDKQIVLSVLCSLLNTTMKYNPATWKVPSTIAIFKDPKEFLVNYSLQLLVVLMLYPMPETNNSTPQRNQYRHFAGRIHRPQDFQFIVDGMLRILNQPLQASSYIPGSQTAVRFAPEVLMLFWELIQCNKRFRSFIIDTERMHDFTVLLLYYALENKSDASKQGIVRMCAFILQTLSVEPKYGRSLNKVFEAQETLPVAVRINDWRPSYADFLLQSTHTLISTSQGKLTAIYPALLAVINNIAPYLSDLRPTTSLKLIQMFNSMSSPSFLFANETNHDLLRSLLESISSVLEYQWQANAELVMAILRNQKRFETLRNFTLEGAQLEIEKRNRRRKDAGAPSNSFDASSRRSSADSARSPENSHFTGSTLRDVPEDEAFAIGDDDSDDDESRPLQSQMTPSQSSAASETHSRPASAQTDTEDALPTQLRGMSEKARGKMPAGSHFSRQNSSTSLSGRSTTNAAGAGGTFEPTAEWIETWLPELPLHTILAAITQVPAIISDTTLSVTADKFSDTQTLAKISNIHLQGISPSPIKIHSFEWSPLALGWYESLIWSFIFGSEMQVAKGNVGVWNGTHIKLFRVVLQEGKGAGGMGGGVTLMAPRGAVDAVGGAIVERIGSLNLRGSSGTAARDQPTS